MFEDLGHESPVFLSGISSQFNCILVLDDYNLEFGVRLHTHINTHTHLHAQTFTSTRLHACGTKHACTRWIFVMPVRRCEGPGLGAPRHPCREPVCVCVCVSYRLHTLHSVMTTYPE